jgi:hypothetical protein
VARCGAAHGVSRRYAAKTPHEPAAGPVIPPPPRRGRPVRDATPAHTHDTGRGLRATTPAAGEVPRRDALRAERRTALLSH